MQAAMPHPARLPSLSDSSPWFLFRAGFFFAPDNPRVAANLYVSDIASVASVKGSFGSPFFVAEKRPAGSRLDSILGAAGSRAFQSQARYLSPLPSLKAASE
jgi:hypothetical protein